MRLEENDKDSQQWKCLFCFHVRSGTIIYGLFHLILHIAALFLICLVLVHPDLLNKQTPSAVFVVGEEVTPQPGDTDRQLLFESKYTFFSQCKWTTHDINIGLSLTLCSFAITMLMVYGAVKGHAVYLLPFFCVQVFSFCTASLSVIAYFSYMPDVRQIILNDPSIPFRQQLLQLDAGVLSFATLVLFITIMMIKAYFVGVVWSCYKYLVHLNAENLERMDRLESGSQVLLPPDYTTVVKDKQYHLVPLVMTSPPPYSSNC